MKTFILCILVAGCSAANRTDPNADLSFLPDLSHATDLLSPGDQGGGGLNVVINELYPNGPSGSDPDFAELFNLGAATADLSGYKVRDNDMADLFTLPAGTTVPPGGYLVIYCDDETDGGVTGGIHVPWKLSGGNGDEFHLIPPAGAEIMTSFAAGAAPAGKSWARLPDGTGSFQVATPTRGTANLP